MKFRLTTTVEYKDDDLKALKSLAKKWKVTPREWLEINLLRNGETAAQDCIWDEVQYLFEQGEDDE